MSLENSSGPPTNQGIELAQVCLLILTICALHILLTLLNYNYPKYSKFQRNLPTYIHL